MDRQPGLSIVLLRPLAAALGQLGADPAAFLAELGVAGDPEHDAFVPGSLAGEALSRAARALGQPALGLALASRMPSGSFGTFDHAVWTGGTLRDAIARSSHFYALVTEGVSLSLVERDGAAHVSMRAPRAARHGRVLTDLAVALNVLRAREATGGALRLRSVTFRHRGVDGPSYDRFFGTTVAFSQPADGVVFDAALLSCPVRSPTGAGAIEARAAAMQALVASGDPWLDRVRAAALRGVWARDASLARLAREMSMGPRSLQRALKDAATSHRAVVDDVRRLIAVQLLSSTETPILEVAYESGFARLAAFYRAFSRWTGTTPRAFRLACASPPREG